jgi:hypothetical protein
MTTDAGDLLDRLDERALLLEMLLDGHPGRHLLAEYETTLLEPCCSPPQLQRNPELLDHASNLLARMEHVILSLGASSSEVGPGRIPDAAAAPQGA